MSDGLFDAEAGYFEQRAELRAISKTLKKMTHALEQITEKVLAHDKALEPGARPEGGASGDKAPWRSAEEWTGIYERFPLLPKLRRSQIVILGHFNVLGGEPTAAQIIEKCALLQEDVYYNKANFEKVLDVNPQQATAWGYLFEKKGGLVEHIRQKGYIRKMRIGSAA